ncbi:MAG: hypothetical protein RXQ68_01385 [Candidatus Nanopusillus sp.]
MSDNLDKRLEKTSNEQSDNGMVVVKEWKDNERRYVEEYNIPTIIGLIASSVKWYEKLCNTKLSSKDFKEILNEVGKKLGITEDLSHYLLDDKSTKYIVEQLEKPEYLSGDHKYSLMDFDGLIATYVVLVKNNKECLEKGKEKDLIVETLVNYIKPEIRPWEDYKENLFYKIRAYKL